MLPIFRIGFDYDVHKLVEECDLWLGGIKIEHPMGLLGHSGADVLIHAICDALLGVADMRDINYHSLNISDEALNMDSKVILQRAMILIATKGYQPGSVNATVCIEQPRINSHIPTMRSRLARSMQTDENNISIGTTTGERMGFVGRQGGMVVYATVLIVKA